MFLEYDVHAIQVGIRVYLLLVGRAAIIEKLAVNMDLWFPTPP
jgi:hypothetical protein